MPRTSVTVETADGTCAATLHTPAPDAGPVPGVLVYPDAVGVRETFSVLADRLAALGYAVLLPDIYYRTPYEPFDAANVFADLDRVRALAVSLTPAMAERDATAFLDFLAARPEAGGDRIGTVGYCMGGRLALLAAARHPDRVGAAASIHGGNLAPEGDPDSPAAVADRIKAAVHIAVAENDPSFPADQYERLESAFSAAGVDHTIETYPAPHGFAVSDNPSHAAEAEERHWAALAKLYAGALSA